MPNIERAKRLLLLACILLSTSTSANWLDEPLLRWNVDRNAVPFAPIASGSEARIRKCFEIMRAPELDVERELTEKHWHLFGPRQTFGNTRLVTALADVDDTCRPISFQGFVFSGKDFAGTLSPIAMNSRQDQALKQALLVSQNKIHAEFVRYESDTPICCPTKMSVVLYDIRFNANGPELYPNTQTEHALNRTSEAANIKKWSGFFNHGKSLNVFQPCQSDQIYWLSGDKEQLEAIQKRHRLLTSKPFERIFAVIDGEFSQEPSSGMATKYDGLLNIHKLYEARAIKNNPCASQAEVIRDTKPQTQNISNQAIDSDQEKENIKYNRDWILVCGLSSKRCNAATFHRIKNDRLVHKLRITQNSQQQSLNLFIDFNEQSPTHLKKIDLQVDNNEAISFNIDTDFVVDNKLNSLSFTPSATLEALELLERGGQARWYYRDNANKKMTATFSLWGLTKTLTEMRQN